MRIIGHVCAAFSFGHSDLYFSDHATHTFHSHTHTHTKCLPIHSHVPYSVFFPSVLKFVLFVLLLLRTNIFLSVVGCGAYACARDENETDENPYFLRRTKI